MFQIRSAPTPKPLGAIITMTDNDKYIVLTNLDKKIDEAIYDAINYFQKKCPYCDDLLFTGHIRSKIHVDHYIPISKGGQHVPWNILPVCQRCNSKKLAKKPKLFLDLNKSSLCEDYLEKVRQKYVGQTQIELEKYQQIKTILSTSTSDKLTTSEKSQLFDGIFEIVTGRQINAYQATDIKNFDIDSYIQEVIKKHYSIPDIGDPIQRRSATELYNEIKHLIQFPITVRLLSKNFKTLGFYKRLERVGNETKKAFYVTPVTMEQNNGT